jgi:calcineurin-like phosphoesterase
MVGGVQTVLGVDKDVIVNRFSGNNKASFEYPETGEAEINAVLLTIDAKTGQAIGIEHLHENVVI